MQLRPYQSEAVEAVYEHWRAEHSTLLVMPTGTGKTVTLGEVIRRRPPGKALLMAHREELVFQGVRTLTSMTGEMVGIEMGDLTISQSPKWMWPNIIVTSVQTQNARGRMQRFNPSDFSVLIVDEAHHAVARTYRKVLAHFRQNPDLRILGVTATPDRTDERALGQVFGSVAYDYDLPDAIDDGWLVPVQQRMVRVEGYDLSSVRTTAGDLNGADLERELMAERVLHGFASPTIAEIGDRKTIVFTASVAHAEKLAEIFNRHRLGSALAISGKTPSDLRREIIRDFANRRFQILCNCAIATEGFDDVGIEVVVVARPTKSRAFYAQMVGRGTRPLKDTVDGLATASERRAAIAASAKPTLTVLDFAGNAGKHKLVSATDIFAGNMTDEVASLARKLIEKAGKAKRIGEAVEEAQQELERRRLEEEEHRRKRLGLVVNVEYQTTSIDPFDLFHLVPHRQRAWDAGKPPSEKMVALLERNGVPARNLSFTAARQLIGEIIKRREQKQCTYKQAKVLAKYGYPTDSTWEQAKVIIDAVARNGWQRPDSIPDLPPAPPRQESVPAEPINEQELLDAIWS